MPMIDRPDETSVFLKLKRCWKCLQKDQTSTYRPEPNCADSSRPETSTCVARRLQSSFQPKSIVSPSASTTRALRTSVQAQGLLTRPDFFTIFTLSLILFDSYTVKVCEESTFSTFLSDK